MLLACLTPAHAAIGTQYAAMTRQNDGGYALNADFRVNLPNQLQEAINHGTALTFRVEFTLTRPRWYWTDEDIITISREQRISYNSLTREYRVSNDNNQTRYNTLSEALLNVSRVSQWKVIGPNQVASYEPYQASVRIYLNTNKLPRTYQLNALTHQSWGLTSEWYSFTFTPR